MKEGTPLTITITLGVDGSIKATESRDSIVEEWPGVMVVFGDAAKNKFAHLSWGARKDIVFGFYSSVMDSKPDNSERGEWHRNVLGAVCRMICELYGFFHRRGHMTVEEALAKVGDHKINEEDKEIVH